MEGGTLAFCIPCLSRTLNLSFPPPFFSLSLSPLALFPLSYLPFQSVRSNSVELLVTEDLYWKPASSSILLYDQLARRKFQEITRDQIK